jgi:endonuclease/exonuclease/phosphatase family metal-dependent hydrolase
MRFLVVATVFALSTLSAPAVAAEWPSATPSGLAQVDASPASVSMTWKPVPKAERYRLQVSTSSSMSGAFFERSRDTAETLTNLEPGRLYYVTVRVITDDGVNRSAYSAAVRARTTESPSAGGSSTLTIASYNVRCANCFKHQNLERPWAERRGVVVSSILKQKPDVIGIQEASQGWLKSGSKKVDLSQFEDLRNRLRSGGTPYEVTNKHRNNCVKSTTPSGCKYKDQGASQGTKIFFNTATVSMVSQGSQKLPQCSGCNTRYVAWAVLEQKSTGDRFFFANSHLEATSRYYALRKSQTRAMMDEVELRRPKGMPAFVVGDFNSTRYATPTNAPYDEIVSHGFVDPLGHTYKSPKISSKATAEKRIRAHYNSHNNFVRTVPHYSSNENGSNLDYIFTTKMRTLSWETVLNLDSSGKLAGVIPSDHNMLVAKVRLP